MQIVIETQFSIPSSALRHKPWHSVETAAVMLSSAPK